MKLISLNKKAFPKIREGFFVAVGGGIELAFFTFLLLYCFQYKIALNPLLIRLIGLKRNKGLLKKRFP